MYWDDLPAICLTLSTLVSLFRRRWGEAVWCACLAMAAGFDRVMPSEVPSELKYVFGGVGVILLVYQVMQDYRRYQKSLVER